MTGVRLGRGDMSRGWTFDLGIPEIVAGYSNPTDLEQYRQLRFGGQAAVDAWRSELRHGGLLYYRGLTGEAAQRLLDDLPPSALAEVPEHEDRCQCQELWEIVQSRYGVDDAITFPTRMAAVQDFGARSPRRGWLLWWT